MKDIFYTTPKVMKNTDSDKTETIDKIASTILSYGNRRKKKEFLRYWASSGRKVYQRNST